MLLRRDGDVVPVGDEVWEMSILCYDGNEESVRLNTSALSLESLMSRKMQWLARSRYKVLAGKRLERVQLCSMHDLPSMVCFGSYGSFPCGDSSHLY